MVLKIILIVGSIKEDVMRILQMNVWKSDIYNELKVFLNKIYFGVI